MGTPTTSSTIPFPPQADITSTPITPRHYYRATLNENPLGPLHCPQTSSQASTVSVTQHPCPRAPSCPRWVPPECSSLSPSRSPVPPKRHPHVLPASSPPNPISPLLHVPRLFGVPYACPQALWHDRVPSVQAPPCAHPDPCNLHPWCFL